MEHSSGFVHVTAQWLFAQDMLSGLQGSDGHVGMEFRRCGHHDHIYVVPTNNRRPVRTGIGGRSLRDSFCARTINIGYGSKQSATRASNDLGSYLPDASSPNDGHGEHVVSPM